MEVYICIPKRRKISAADGLKFEKGRLAQLVQSICLTSRGSLVRTQYLPPKPTKVGFFCTRGV